MKILTTSMILSI